MTYNHSEPLPDGSHPEAEANVRSYAHHRFWAETFDALATALHPGKRQARAAALALKSRAHAERYAQHLRLYHPQRPMPPERWSGPFVRWLLLHTRGVGLGAWVHIAEWRERRLRRAILRHHGIDRRRP